MISLGCPKNLVDSEILIGNLDRAGFTFTGEPEDADVIIVNTCSFIAPAVEEATQVLNDMAVLKREGRCRALICAGCLTHREGARLPADMPEVDAFLRVDDIPRVHEVVTSLLAGNPAILSTQPTSYLYDHTAPRVLATPPWTAYVKIADGCHHHCSFCTIPAIRGAYRSRDPQSVLAEVKNLAAHGVQEVILIGQDVTAYGRDNGANLPDLLEKIGDVPGIAWIRLMYSFPGEITERLLETMARLPNVCHYLDLPLQHAHPRVLRAMHRPGSADHYLTQLAQARSYMPDIAIRSCFIVGFPGETEEEFQVLLDFLSAAQLDRVGAFMYCAESGTPAAELPDQIPAEVAQERYDRLMTLQQHMSLAINRQLIGKELHVLVEEDERDALLGRSYRDAPEIDGQVIIEQSARKNRPQPGEFVTVQITDATEYDCIGHIQHLHR